MARSTKARGKVVRRLKVNIFGNRKYDKLLKKKPQGPGLERGARPRRKESDYGRQLVEKQKLRYAYGLGEKQFYNFFLRAKKIEGLTGDNMMILLERRLDNVVYRLGWAQSRAQARQFVSHGHIKINGNRSDIPSMLVKAGDQILLKDKDSTKKIIRECQTRSSEPVPSWLSVKEDELIGIIEHIPDRKEIPTTANEQMVVEFYSK